MKTYLIITLLFFSFFTGLLNADVTTDDPIRTLTEHTYDVWSVAFSPDGQTLASGSWDNTIRLWDVKTGETIHTLTEHTASVNSVVFSPDGQTLASGSSDNTIRLWNVRTRTTIHTLTGHTDTVWNVAFSPDGKTLASASWDNTIRLWNVKTGDPLRTLIEHTDHVVSVAFSPDGQTLASASWDNTIRLWNVKTGETTNTLTEHMAYVWSVAFSPDGQTLVSASSDNTIRLWDVKTGDPLRTFRGHRNYIWSVAFSPDGKTLASGSWDRTIRLWDVKTGETIQTLRGHTAYIFNVAFSPDGQTLASGSLDSTVLLWNLTGVGGDTQSIAAREMIINFQIEQNDKEVTIYQENDDMLVFTFGVLGETPELEYKGQILATVKATAVLWGEDVESLMDLSSALTNADGTWVVEQNTGTETITTAANSTESNGFVRVFAATGLVSQSVYIFRTGSREYVVESTTAQPFNVSEPDIDAYQSYRLTILSPDGEVYRQWDVPPVAKPTPTITDAIPLPINSSRTKKIDPGNDVDYFSVQVEASGTLTVRTTGTLDTIGQLQNSEGAILAENDNQTESSTLTNGGGTWVLEQNNGLNFSITHNVEPGVYYIKVESYGLETGDYTIHAEFRIAADVNGDGNVNVLDLVAVATAFGETATPADVNNDGSVNVLDLVAVAAAFGEGSDNAPDTTQ